MFDLNGRETLYALLHELFELTTIKFSINGIDLAASWFPNELCHKVDVSQFSIPVISESRNKFGIMSDMVDNKEFINDPLTSMYSKGLEMLSLFVQSDDVEIAIVAKDTLKSLLQLKRGQNYTVIY